MIKLISILEAVVQLVEAGLDVAPEILKDAQLAIALLKAEDEPTGEELESIEASLAEAHQTLQDELSRKLK